MKKKIKIDYKKKMIECNSNFKIIELLKYLEIKNLTLPVLPGTGQITIGGAIASDVHGKNHVYAGSFCNHVEEITIMSANGKIIKCTPQKKQKLFKATCGGMGLTGIILSAKIKIKKLISNTMEIKNYFIKDIDELIKLLKIKNEYMVTWLDFYSIKGNFLRAILSVGSFVKHDKKDMMKFKIPQIFNKLYFNLYFIRLFNFIFYNIKKFRKKNYVNYKKFLLPFDNFDHDKKFYGNQKIIQIQILIRNKYFKKNLIKFLRLIKKFKLNCYLVGLKKFGKKNSNFLSFPEEGYTITADFLIEQKKLSFLNRFINELFIGNYKFYLTKDILLNKKHFLITYPDAHKFLAVKKKYDNINKIHSSLFSRILH